MRLKPRISLPQTYTRARLGNRRKFRRYILLILIFVTAYLLYYRLPDSRGIIYDKDSPGETENNNHNDYKGDDDEVTAHFFNPSSFREYPDVEYEYRIDAALQELERKSRSVDDRIQANNTIWQTGRDGGRERSAYSEMFEDDNPEWTYSFLTDTQAKAFVTETFGSIPDLIAAYRSYPYNILRADFLRYLLLWYHGGFYADLDARPRRSIKTCPALKPLFSTSATTTTTTTSSSSSTAIKSAKSITHNISLVVGIEIDEPYTSLNFMREWRWSRTYGFAQWTIYAPRRFSPILRKVIVRVLAHTKRYNEQRRSGNENKNSLLRWNPFRTLTKWNWNHFQNEVLSITGPRVFTDAILDLLSEALPRDHALVETSVDTDQGIGELVSTTKSSSSSSSSSPPPSGDEMEEKNVTVPRVTWAPFHRLERPLWIDASEGNGMGGLGVLPVNVWGNGQRHSGAETFQSVHACVNHLFQGTWKKWWWQKLFK